MDQVYRTGRLARWEGWDKTTMVVVGTSEIFAVDEQGSVLEHHDEIKDRITTTNSSSARERRGMGTHPPLDSHLYVADPKDGAWGNPQTAPATHAVRTYPQEHLLFQQRSEESLKRIKPLDLWTKGTLFDSCSVLLAKRRARVWTCDQRSNTKRLL